MPSRNSIIIREGFRFIIPLALITVLTAVLGMIGTACFLFLLTAFNIWFFRNPERRSPQTPGSVVSPADGRILKIEEVEEPLFLKGQCVKISVFMNIFDVHVNRIPYPGEIEAVSYKQGAFISANLDKASEKNERNLVLLKTSEGTQILFIQIAGLIARRIVCWIEQGMRVEKGERFGLICFGSRLELFLPFDARITVNVGDRVKAGTTIMGYLS
jgi:phosphatidylserine decarboxylase